MIRLDGGTRIGLYYNVERFCILIVWNFGRLYLYSRRNFARYFFEIENTISEKYIYVQIARKGRIVIQILFLGYMHITSLPFKERIQRRREKD